MRSFPSRLARLLHGLIAVALLTPLWAPAGVAPVLAAPVTVTTVGSLQSEASAGVCGDWDPACAATHLTYDAGDDVWQGTWSLPAGSFEYKAALNDSWAENYGAGGAANGANIPLSLAAPASVKFYYDDKSHWITSNATSVIAMVPGSFQSELGCPGDWDPSCLRSWLQDPDGDGTYTFVTTSLPAGSYEGKVALNESWDVNYGQGGVQNGANLAFTVPANAKVTFSWNSATHVLDIAVQDNTVVALVGSLQSEASAGACGDWDPACAATRLTYDAGDDVWQGTWTLPAGGYEYKAALNNSWDVNYGAGGAPGGANIGLNLGASQAVKFYFDPKSHWITSSATSIIAVAPGSFQSELGCPGDWDPGCLRSWLQDLDGDGVYTFETTALPAGSYEGKVALNESWDVNYGQGGVQNGANLAFTVPAPNTKVIFTYTAATHVLTIVAGHFPDNNVEWDGLRHDSRDPLYRTPGGAVPAGTPVTLRFRTFHNDVTSVKARVYSLNAGGQQILPMSLAAADVSCYQAGLESQTCDFWAVTLPDAAPDNLWYRFIVADGTSTAYYADNTAALDGGLGAANTNAVDNSYALMVYQPGFTAPAWAKGAVIYQIFPDRFRNGRKDNDPKTGDVRYDEPVLKLPWGTLPEGYCRGYAGADNVTCPWRYGPPPAWAGPTQAETPRGRDYQGGDLKGVDQQLDYLKALGVTAIYFNPIFDAGSNHGYDTQNYFKVDPYFGTQKDWENLVKHADRLGIRIILDGVYNHMSSDSPFFDRYGHFLTLGACESVRSPYRSWFTFHDVAAGTGACAGSAGPKSANYDGWFGFDSIPVLNKSNPAVQRYFVGAHNSVATTWLEAGADAWRLDVMGDASFPNGYWETFRQSVKAEKPSTLIIGELWQKDSTLLRYLRGDRADTTMNYRLRDALLGFFTPGGRSFDSKGFGDSGRQITAAEFTSRLASIREDYPDAAYYSLMNLLDSHDTERLLWALTPGSATLADRQLNAANLAAGKQTLRVVSTVQFTLPGAPTVYSGDEVGVTGADDPDDRRAYPWADLGGQPDLALYQHYQALAQLRRQYPVLVDGSFQVLFADGDVVAFGRKTGHQAAIILVNRGQTERAGAIPVAGFLPDGVALSAAYTVGSGSGAAVVAGGQLPGTIGANSALVLVTGRIDLTPPAAPAGLSAAEGVGQVTLTWSAAAGAVSYNVYRSPVTGGGYVQVNAGPVAGLSFTDTGLRNAVTDFYVVRAVDAAGNESGPSNEVAALPHLNIGWANLQWPPTLDHTISAINRTGTVYGQVWIDGATSQPGQTPTLRAQLGYGPDGSTPAGNPAWTWVDAGFNVDAGSNDEFQASLLPEQTGTFDYAYRYTTTNGRDWVYADLDGLGNGYSPDQAGSLTVQSSGDTTAPAVPANPRVTNTSPTAISLAWDAVSGDASLYGYEVLRGSTAGGPYTLVARVTGIDYTDGDVVQDTAYFYVVRSLDQSFNRSGHSAEVSAVAAARTVSVVFNVTVPATTDATGRAVYIAGFLDRLDGGLPQWSPAGVVLTRVDATHWTLTLTGKEFTQIEYKYVQGDWNYVEKDAGCGEIGNRQLTLSYGANGTQTVNDTVENWRNVAPCGN